MGKKTQQLIAISLVPQIWKCGVSEGKPWLKYNY